MPEPLDTALGIDLGGTRTRVALVCRGAVLRRAAEPTDAAGGPSAVLGQVRRMVGEVFGAGDHRSGERPAPGLVNAGDRPAVELQLGGLQLEGRNRT